MLISYYYTENATFQGKSTNLVVMQSNFNLVLSNVYCTQDTMDLGPPTNRFWATTRSVICS